MAAYTELWLHLHSRLPKSTRRKGRKPRSKFIQNHHDRPFRVGRNLPISIGSLGGMLETSAQRSFSRKRCPRKATGGVSFHGDL